MIVDSTLPHHRRPGPHGHGACGSSFAPVLMLDVRVGRFARLEKSGRL